MAGSIERLLAYDAWANEEALGSLVRARVIPPRALRFMAHILAAERLWLGRLNHDPSPIAVWPDHNIDECKAGVAALPTLWRSYLDRCAEGARGGAIPYTNTQGERWTSDIGDILTHVVLHSAYHRGQIASELRTGGETPATTDFIHCMRQGFVE